MSFKKPLLLVAIVSTFFLTVGCEDKNADDESKPTFKGYWMVDEQKDLVAQALSDSSCSLILNQEELHPTEETIQMTIISIWDEGSVFALDTIIKTGATSAQAHPDSVTAANIPGRFVDQGTLFVEGAFSPSENDSFSLTPFEIEDPEKQSMTFALQDFDVMTFEVAEEDPIYSVTYHKINLKNYIEYVNFSQSCLDREVQLAQNL